MKSITFFATAAAISLAVTPAMAQEEEEARTTYAVTALNLADDADDRWLEIQNEYVQPARVAAGMSEATIHWVMISDDYDIIMVSEMPDGMATFDSHAPASRMAFVEAMTEIAGSEEARDAIWEEMGTLVESSTTVYTHTHP